MVMSAASGNKTQVEYEDEEDEEDEEGGRKG
jgi:hypothetical protein